MHLASAILNGLLVVLVVLGICDMLFFYEKNRCSMTYMFEYPEYQKIKLSKKVTKLFPTYELYLYGEGIYAEKNKNLSLNGVPVLFLPGNAGSYKQARSFGSIALRKAENIDNMYHFDVFTVHFNEELVALYGGSLKKQTEFVYICIKVILNLYKNQEYHPQSVALIGHSMGGLIARALFTLKNFKPQLINLIITQATPHRFPVLSVDNYLTDFYAMVNNYWILNYKYLRNVTILSIAGGFRDYQVRSGLTSLPRSEKHDNALSVVTTAVPITWASTDHLSIVWCKELILATTRALFDLIDEKTRQITVDPGKRMSVLRHHFVRHPATQYDSLHENITCNAEFSSWNFVGTTYWKHSVNNVSNETYFAFSLKDKRSIHSHFHCRSTFLYAHSWIFGCEHGSWNCLKIKDLTSNTELLPTIKNVMLKLEDFPRLSHFVIHVPETNNTKFSVECEFLREDLQTKQLPVTHVLSFGFSSSQIKTNSSGLLHVFELQGFSKIYQAFDITIEKSCEGPIDTTLDLFRFHVPWSHEDLIKESSDGSIQLSAKLHMPQPQNDSRMVTLTLYTSFECQYEIKISTSLLQIVGQVMRFHGMSLPVYIVSNLFLTYGAQLSSLSSKGQCLEFDALLESAAKPYKVDPIINIFRILLGFDWFKNTWDSLLLPQPDSTEMYSLGLLFPVISFLLFMFGTGIAYWSGMLFKVIIELSAAVWRAVKRKTDNPTGNISLKKKVFVEGLLLSLVSWKTCGSLSILLIFIRYFVQVSRQASFLNESWKAKKGSNNLHIDSDFITTSESFKMHITILNLLLWLLLMNLPSLLYWAKNIRYNIQLEPDPVRLLAVPLVFTLIFLMNSTVTPIKSSNLLKTAAQIQLPFSILTVAFGTLHLYRVSYFITFSFCIHLLMYFL